MTTDNFNSLKPAYNVDDLVSIFGQLPEAVAGLVLLSNKKDADTVTFYGVYKGDAELLYNNILELLRNDTNGALRDIMHKALSVVAMEENLGKN